jgi:2-phosphoglycerate kinase
LELPPCGIPDKDEDAKLAEHLRGAGARDWSVLLIGGSSGVGKTTLARDIARRTGATLAHSDDYRMALERVVTPVQNPELHAFAHAGPEALEPELAVSAWRRIAGVVSHALEVVVAHHAFGATPLVIEGDALLPSFAVQSEYAGYAVSGAVRALYLVEPDEAVVRANLQARGRDRRLGPDGLERYGRASWLYGCWMAESAFAHGIPVLPARPWEGLAERALAALSGDDEREIALLA